MLPGSTFSVCTSQGASSYQIDCPVYRHEYANGTVELYNQVVPTKSCPVCSGNCSYPPAAVPTAAPAPAATAAADALSAAAIGGAAAGGVLGLAAVAFVAKLLLGGAKASKAAAAGGGGGGSGGSSYGTLQPWGNTAA